MNVTDLARRLKVTPHELLTRLPKLGFDVGHRAIKIDDVLGEKIFKKWIENERRERLRDSLVISSKGQAREGQIVEKKDIILPQYIIVRELAGRLNLPVTKVIQQLMKAGILASQNERLDFETAAIISEELGFSAKLEEENSQDAVEVVQALDRVKEIMESEAQEDLEARPPVVVVMGHVDHGKTKTLDAIRKTNVVEHEAGGITQHIGAYQTIRKDRLVTFIDTPGHEAFTVMRSRGAKVADIAILVVAADDGVQPQTKEAINIIHAAKLPFVVALNKIDKPEADPDRVLSQLSEAGVTTEAWGGNVPMAKISAKAGTGIDELLDLVLLVADMNADKIRANPKRLAMGTIIESHVDKGEGPVATILIQGGTLHRNDYIGISGAAYGRVRSMRDWTGKQIDEAKPGTPVKILGFRVAPAVGDILEVPEDPKILEIKKVKTNQQVASQLTATKMISSESEKNAISKKVLNIVIKCDTLGSLEALLGMFEKIQHEDVGVEVIQKGLGNVTEGDITRAENSPPSVVYSFNVVVTPQASLLARDKNVEVKEYRIIYELFDDVIKRLNILVPPEIIRLPLGSMEVAAIFRTESSRMVVGGKVLDGKVITGERVKVWRAIAGSPTEREPLGIGSIDTVQIGKQVVKEAHGGQECGIGFSGKVKIQIGDKLEIYHEEVKERKIVLSR